MDTRRTAYTKNEHIPVALTPLYPRTRLLTLLEHDSEHKLIVVTAPAGSGKTSVVSQWLHTYGHLAAWLSLEPVYDDFERFWELFLLAMDSLSVGMTERLQPYFDELKPTEYTSFVMALIQELHRFDKRVVLVLDDLQWITNTDIHNVLTFFIQQLPRHVKVVILTRNDPAVMRTKWLVEGDVQLIDAREVAFTREESIQFFRHTELNLTEKQIDKLVDKTEGWAVGMKLVAMSLQAPVSDERLEELLHGYQRSISDYLFEEIYRDLPADVRSFVLDTAFVTRMNASLCASLTERLDCRRMLEYLERQNLFIVLLDSKNEWYRYHHLFSEFLRNQLDKEDPARIPVLHARAAKWFQEAGQYAEAVEHFLQGKHYSEALALIEVLCPVMIGNQGATLFQWLTTIPTSILERTPELYFVRVILHMHHADRATAEMEIGLAEITCHRYEQQYSQEMRDHYWSEFYFILAYHAYYILHDLNLLVNYTRKHLQLNRKKTVLWMFNTNAGAVSILDNFNGINGRPKLGATVLLEMTNLMRPSIVSSVFQIGYAESLYEWNRVDEAREEALAAFLAGKQIERGEVIVPALILLSDIEVAFGKPQAAFAWLDTGIAILGDTSPKWKWALEVQRFYLRLPTMQKHDIEAWLEASLLLQSGLDQLPFSLHEWIVIVTAWIKLRDYEQALARLELLRSYTEQNDRYREYVHIVLLRSIVHYELGHIDEAIASLTHALQRGEEQELIRTFVDHGSRIRELLEHYTQLRQNNHIRGSDRLSLTYVKRLASCYQLNQVLYYDDDTVEELSKDLFTPTELTVLDLLLQDLSNSEIAKRLNVSKGTVKTHLNHIYSKMNVHERWKAIQIAKRFIR